MGIKYKDTKTQEDKDFDYTFNLINRIGPIRFALYKTWKNALSEIGYEIDDITYTTYQNWLKKNNISEETLVKEFPKSNIELHHLTKNKKTS